MRFIQKFHLYHAPWSRWFKTFFLRGQYAWELQVGPVVFYLFYVPWEDRRVHVRRDPYWRF